MQNNSGIAAQDSSWNTINERSEALSFGARMNPGNDKELNDLLDFSAMFSPPNARRHQQQQQQMKNGPNNMDNNMYQGHPAYKPGMNDGGPWNPNSQPTPAGYESRLYENAPYNGQSRGDEMHPFNMNNNDNMPPLMNKNTEMTYGKPPGMINSNVPMSPESLPTTGSRGGGKYTPPEAGGGRRKVGPVYSPNADEYPQDSPRYTSPKPGMYGDYFLDTPHSNADPWSSNNALPSSTYPSTMLPSSSHYSQASSYNNMHHPHDMGYPPISPNQEAMLSSGLPPMSSFRGQTMPATSSPTVNGSEIIANRPNPVNTQQTGDALGKALASIYSTEHTGSSYGGSNPSTPVSSPPPMSASSSQWHRPTNHSATSQQHFEGHLHPMARAEDRLEDAIHVLRNHAEGQLQGLQHPGLPPMMPPTHSNGMMGGIGPYSGMLGSHMDSHMGSHSSVPGPDGRPAENKSKFSTLREQPSDQPTTDGSIKVEKIDKGGDAKVTEPNKKAEKKISAPPTKRSRRVVTDEEEEDDTNPEGKQEREKVRRQANNARERVRVRDINEAFKELGSMVTIHCSAGQPLTKLMVLQQAVNVITSLEGQVRERNLNPKAACLKRREEEKTEDLPGRSMNSVNSVNSEDLAQQAVLADSAALNNQVKGIQEAGGSTTTHLLDNEDYYYNGPVTMKSRMETSIIATKGVSSNTIPVTRQWN
ncbi:transcription factor 4 isoform X3 [Patella vulgata]|uniref:transcription factor 4 isoform X3 n=1 Tax=Patella vulgata TaxID=6465 RepID=UPI00217F49FA|nr:transcription factor 4 isoform X3 [Patella vulgata]